MKTCDSFCIRASIFYVITMYLIQRKGNRITIEISIGYRHPKNGISFISSSLIERDITENISYTFYEELLKIVEKYYSKKEIPSYYVNTNISVKNIHNYEKIKNTIIAKSNYLEIDNFNPERDNGMTQIYNYISIMFEVAKAKIILYQQDNKKKYEGIIL